MGWPGTLADCNCEPPEVVVPPGRTAAICRIDRGCVNCEVDRGRYSRRSSEDHVLWTRPKRSAGDAIGRPAPVIRQGCAARQGRRTRGAFHENRMASCSPMHPATNRRRPPASNSIHKADVADPVVQYDDRGEGNGAMVFRLAARSRSGPTTPPTSTSLRRVFIRGRRFIAPNIKHSTDEEMASRRLARRMRHLSGVQSCGVAEKGPPPHFWSSLQSPDRFRAVSQADGRQPFMPRDYLTIPAFEQPYPFVFVQSEAEAAAFRRARRGRLSSSDNLLCHSSGLVSRIFRKRRRTPFFRRAIGNTRPPNGRIRQPFLGDGWAGGLTHIRARRALPR